ncbi:MAG: c-type cytochrome [Planctomycetota bacterium]
MPLPSVRSIVAFIAIASMACATFLTNPPQSDGTAARLGEQILTERGCLNCHVSDFLAERPLKYPAPNLETVASRIAPGFIKEYLKNPEKLHPGSRMPDVFANVPEDQRNREIELLLNYLFDQKNVIDRTPHGVELREIEDGRKLYHQIGCVACHGAFDPPAAAIENASPLPDLTTKTNLPALTAFLLDPNEARPSGRMPKMNLTNTEARSIAAYLLRGQLARDANGELALAKGPGVHYSIFMGSWSELPDFSKLSFVQSGVSPNIQLPANLSGEHFGVVYSGFLNLPAGEHTFRIESDDGARLIINNKTIIDNDGIHASTQKTGTANLTGKNDTIRVEFFEFEGGENLALYLKRPDGKFTEVDSTELYHDAPALGLAENWVSFNKNPKEAREGSRVFGARCSACHAPPDSQEKWSAKPASKYILQVNLDNPAGCNNNGAADRPKYSLTKSETESIKTAINISSNKGARTEPEEVFARTLISYRCIACHERDGAGKPGDTTIPWFTTLGEAEMGDEGRIPPPLTGIGRKLHPRWMGEVISRNGRVRPYMATRMPQFQSFDVEFELTIISRIIDKSDRTGEPVFHESDVENGRLMIGAGAFSCITCHKFAGNESLGIPAMDLATTTKRINYAWFRDYLLEPGKLRPGTRMPQFWPDGKSSLNHILDGDTERQIEALWVYLSLGDAAPLPKGLRSSADHELRPVDAPIVFRTFMNGVGPRAIAVGLPENIHYAFDAGACRIATIWRGKFISASSAWVARAGQFTDPLSKDLITLPPGINVYVSDPADMSKPADAADADAMKFLGYALDEKGIPTFRYEYKTSEITETCNARIEQFGPVLKRKIKQNGPVRLWMRLDAGPKIFELEPNHFEVQNAKAYRIKTSIGPRTHLRRQDGQFELFVEIPVAASVEVEYRWQS